MLKSGSHLFDFIDRYDIQARVYPAFLLLAPVGVLIVCLYQGMQVIAPSAVTCIACGGGAFTLSRLARDAGKRIQARLFAKWGSSPSIQLLRHRDDHFDPHTKESIHTFLSKSFKPMPTERDEEHDPAAADQLYQAATVWMIEQTRDTKKYALLFKENIAFGFERNMLGLKPLGLVVSAICLLWVLVNAKTLAFSAPFVYWDSIHRMTPEQIVAFVVAIVFFLWWLVRTNENAVKRTALAYAERLWQCCLQKRPAARKSIKKTDEISIR